MIKTNIFRFKSFFCQENTLNFTKQFYQEIAVEVLINKDHFLDKECRV